jgi:hypothetical protein
VPTWGSPVPPERLVGDFNGTSSTLGTLLNSATFPVGTTNATVGPVLNVVGPALTAMRTSSRSPSPDLARAPTTRSSSSEQRKSPSRPRWRCSARRLSGSGVAGRLRRSAEIPALHGGAIWGNSGLPHAEFPVQTEPICKPALPAGFVFQTVVASTKTRFEARRSPSSSSGSMAPRGFPGLAGALLCRSCRNYARNRFGYQAAGAVDCSSALATSLPQTFPAWPGTPSEYNRHFVPSKSLTQK